MSRPRHKPYWRLCRFCPRCRKTMTNFIFAPIADKGYDSADVRSTIGLLGYTDPIKSRGQEATARQAEPGYGARRWVCERTHSWMNRYRGLLIRWEKKVANYNALLSLACAHIVWKRSIIFG